jgi:hypothetical protein
MTPVGAHCVRPKPSGGGSGRTPPLRMGGWFERPAARLNDAVILSRLFGMPEKFAPPYASPVGAHCVRPKPSEGGSGRTQCAPDQTLGSHFVPTQPAVLYCKDSSGEFL